MSRSYKIKKNPLISVGIPTYSRPNSLRRVLLEITRQTYTNLEIIVSDNASPNADTEDVVREIMRNDHRVKYFKQLKNNGPVFNFQFVLEQASGEYFMWAADDDWHDKSFIEVLYQKLLADESAVVSFCDFDSRDENGMLISGYPNFYKILKRMCQPSKFVRQVQYFILREGSAKPHPIYGLIRRKVLHGFSWIDFVDRYGWNASDVLFVFYLMAQGRLALSNQKLFGCTVDNLKNYETNRSKWNLSTYSNFIGQQLKYIFGYLKIANGLVRVALILLLPLKLLEIIYLFAIKPSVNLLKSYFNKMVDRGF
ncbi:MAG TPA: hypothetical protein DCO68_05545 [Methylophilaceae bacterium]|nr:hypothetical protein [Methylophilaceae bacterium]HAJ71524.1 hypothetical protein [Methylophilaceae bacterium]